MCSKRIKYFEVVIRVRSCQKLLSSLGTVTCIKVRANNSQVGYGRVLSLILLLEMCIPSFLPILNQLLNIFVLMFYIKKFD